MPKLSIKEAIKLLRRYDNEHYTPQHREAHRMAIEALEQTQWIPVKERLPEESVWADCGELIEFLVMIVGAEVPTTLCFNGHEFFNASDGERYPITHWMPMVKAPKEKEE